jgi:hypothetical protein
MRNKSQNHYTYDTFFSPYDRKMGENNDKISRVHFGGGSWMVVTYGAALTEIEKERRRPDSVFAETIEWSGTSAGAWTLMFYMLGIPVEEQMATTDKYAQVATQMLRETGSISLTEVPIRWLKEINDEYPEAYKVMNENRCSIYVATKSQGVIRRSNFTSNLDLFNTMLCSAHIPYLCTYESVTPLTTHTISLEGGERPDAEGGMRPDACIDGGIGFDVERDLGGDEMNTLFIACRDPRANINFQCPTFWMVFPPPALVRNYYFRRGMDMMAAYFRGRRGGKVWRGCSDPKRDPKRNWIKQWMDSPDEDKFSTDVWWFVREHQTITHTFADLERRMKTS